MAAGLASLLAASAWAPYAWSVDWQATYSIGSSLSLSSNARLRREGEEEAGGTARLTLGTVAKGTGRRLKFNTNSFISLISRSITGGADIDQRLRAISSFELLENQVFVDGNFTSTRELISSASPISGGDAAADFNQRTSVTSISLSPYWQRRYGRWAQSLVRYRHTEVIAEGATNNSRNDNLELQLVGGDKIAPWRPALTAEAVNNNQRASAGRTENDLTRFSIAFGNQLALSRRYSLTASIGYDKIDTSSDTRDLSGVSWSVGTIMRPGPRTNISFSFGQRFGEPAIEADMRYEITPRLSLRLQATQNLNSGLQRLVNDSNLVTVDPLTGELVTPAGVPAGFVNSGINAGISVQQTFEASLVGDYGRNRIIVSAVQYQREFDDGNDQTTRVRGSFTRALSPYLSATASSFYRFNTLRTGAKTQTLNGRLDLNYRIGPRATVFSGYSFTTRLSDDANREYVEHVGTVGGRVTF